MEKPIDCPSMRDENDVPEAEKERNSLEGLADIPDAVVAVGHVGANAVWRL